MNETGEQQRACTSAGAAMPIRKRRFSAKIQPTRVKKVMQSDEDIGRMVASVPVAVGRAMEHFAEKLLEAAAAAVNVSGSKTLSPAHIKTAAENTPHFRFLDALMTQVPTASSSRPTGGGSISNGAGAIGKRRLSKQSSGDSEESCDRVSPPSHKPKRGRPKKLAKSVIDEDEAVDDEMDSIQLSTSVSRQQHSIGVKSNGNKSDQELMPPPPVPPISRIV